MSCLFYKIKSLTFHLTLFIYLILYFIFLCIYGVIFLLGIYDVISSFFLCIYGVIFFFRYIWCYKFTKVLNKNQQ